MLLQHTLSLQNPNTRHILSSSLSYSSPTLHFPSFFNPPSSTFPHAILTSPRTLSLTCAISDAQSSRTLRYKRRPVEAWKAISKRISLIENPEVDSSTVLNEWESKRNWIKKLDVSRVIKDLRKFNKHRRALEVYDWMDRRPERYRITPSDTAIQLDLIAKVHGVTSAEAFFLRLPDKGKNQRTYGALLNVYVHFQLKEKAESLFDTMKNKGYAVESLTFNVMMTLYMNFKDYDKVDMLVSEMTKNNVKLDAYSYNIWLSSCGSRGSAEKMEQVFDQMRNDPNVAPNCSTFTTMATTYIKMNLFEKAEECIRKAESKIEGRDRIPYHYVLSLYGSIGKKDEVYRVWNNYKLSFPSIPNLGYHSVISSLVRMDDIEGAENLYEQWLSAKSFYDPRIGNLLLGWYVKNGYTDKAISFFDRMKEDGVVPNPSTWEVLSMLHIADKRLTEALSCLKEAFVASGSKSWRPDATNLDAFFKLCEEQGDMASADDLTELLKKSEFVKDEVYASIIGLSDGTICKGEFSSKIDAVDETDVQSMDDNSQMLNQIESSF
ncbi:hypothetical protein PIB30_009296 [Stylosanthes scabra]|uniref:Pentatricopeptide repeat-containing protein n=1 Tax=Stylosanthes scabra TaxID=79078 RepID=A0ABU6T517_9FABA|nr:hypothetical protein [Stylosanthes scabra]